jgi:lysophospholipase L1-like esterase
MLEDAYAERDFEVVNCGVTAINSFALLDFVEEVVHYQPDLILIYAGHNEFVGPYGVTTPFVRVGNNWHLIRAHMFLQRLRLYQGLRELLDAASLWRGGGKEQDFGLHLVRREVYLDSQEHRATEANYRRNLGEIVRLARQRGVPVLLSTLVSNVQGFYPLRSQGPHPDLKGTILEPGKRMAFYTAILEKFPHHAAAHFEAGQVFAGAGDFERAQWAFARARDLDAIHLRACSPFNRIIREVARDKGVILVDSEQVFGKHSPRGLVGNELVAEYLHPSVYGHYLMAQGMVEVLVEHQQALDLEGGNAERLASFEEYARRLGYSPRQQVHARNDLILFLRNMPYQERPQVLRQRLAELVAAQLAELPGLSYGEILDFARRGGLYFLEETIALVEEGDQAPLREKLEDLARPLGLDPRAGPGR